MYYLKKYEHKVWTETLRFLGFTIKWGIHENGYWLTNLNYSFDYMLSNLIIKYFKEKKVKSVLDVGCGYGYYVNELNFHKIKSLGIDGNSKLVNSLKNENIYSFDATNEYFISNILSIINNENKKIVTNKTNHLEDNKTHKKNTNIAKNSLYFDYVLCLNVGEYIPKKKEEIFLKNLDRLNNKGIIISWDVPDSFNIGTINEKSNEEMLDIFTNNYNYTYNEKHSKLFRESCSNNIFKNCTYIFEKKK
ncbi:methyltransferase, putative [Hepatocystis sp. ex Piliocolobus tephrosceles]|nr:methyltransferase, putative [Hepatocystis sp. ex Piliocolobus tephrosceles]